MSKNGFLKKSLQKFIFLESGIPPKHAITINYHCDQPPRAKSHGHWDKLAPCIVRTFLFYHLVTIYYHFTIFLKNAGFFGFWVRKPQKVRKMLMHSREFANRRVLSNMHSPFIKCRNLKNPKKPKKTEKLKLFFCQKGQK